MLVSNITYHQDEKMGYYRRKKAGIFNIGFSSRGIGISTGIKGLRIGLSSSGTPYVSAGAYGFRYRKNLTHKTKQPQIKNEVPSE